MNQLPNIHDFLTTKSHLLDEAFIFEKPFIEKEGLSIPEIDSYKKVICEIIFNRLKQKEPLFSEISNEFESIIKESIFRYIKRINKSIKVECNWTILFFSVYIKCNNRILLFKNYKDSLFLSKYDISKEIYKDIISY